VDFQGADISRYQNEKGPIDWALLKQASAGNWFACKATQRARYKDPYLDYNRESAHTIGFRYIMMYHWQSPTSEASIQDQAYHYLRTVGTLQLNEGVMLDSEQIGITEAETYELKDRILQKTQRPLAVYCGAYVAGGSIWRSNRIFDGVTARHLAAYTSEGKMKSLPGVDPPMPDAWQYSSNGPVPGIVGRCDMNYFYNLSQFDLICGLVKKPMPQPVEDEMNKPYLVKAIVNSDGTVWELANGFKYPITGEYLQCFGPMPESPDPLNFGNSNFIHLIDPNVIAGIPTAPAPIPCKFVPENNIPGPWIITGELNRAL
jgi:hypothetical protein